MENEWFPNVVQDKSKKEELSQPQGPLNQHKKSIHLIGFKNRKIRLQ